MAAFAQWVRAHLAFDATRIAAISTQREALLQHLVEDGLVECAFQVRGKWRLLRAIGDG